MRVTVAIPVYNREGMIRQVVLSALDQQLAEGWDLEVLVVDNCSTDSTAQVVASITDPRLRLVRNDRNLGMFGNFNRCRELATGEFIRYLCSDDFLPKDCLAGEVALLQAHPSAALLNTVGRTRGIDDGPLIGSHFPEGLIPGGQVSEDALLELAQGRNAFNFPSGMLVRAESARRAGAFDEQLLGLADVDYWIQLVQQGDLLSSKRLGCFITEHPGRASYELFYSGSFLNGQITLIRAWTMRLATSPTIVARCRAAMAARCAWYVLKCLRAGRRDGMRAHVRIAREQRFTIGETIVGLVRLVTMRVLGRGDR
ncbi:MAG: glycosyltransferase family 2 protein [bacterium]